MAAKTVVITGASRGIGLATGLRFAKAGCNIVAAGRNDEDLDKALEQFAALGVACCAIVADVGQADAAREIIAAAEERFERVDILVNNAGCAPLGAIEAFSVDDLEQVCAVNMHGVFHTTQAVWPIMVRQGGGVIVHVSSVASVDPFPGFAVYGASKAWVNVFTQAIAAEGKPHGIRVYAVAPGAVETGLLRAAFPTFPADQTRAADAGAAVIESVCDERLAPVSGQTVFVRK